MKLEELYRTEHEGKTLIAIGNGSSEIESVGRERIGRDKFYISTSGKWVAEATGSATQFLYALEEKDFDLFDAYDSLPEGFEMVGYGTGFQIRDDYEYVYYNPYSCKKWTEKDSGYLRVDSIYARRKKEIDWEYVAKQSGCEYLGRETDLTVEDFFDSFLYSPVKATNPASVINALREGLWCDGVSCGFEAIDSDWHWFRKPKKEEVVHDASVEFDIPTLLRGGALHDKNQNRVLFVEWYKRHTGLQLPTKGDCEVYSTFCQMAKTISKKS